MLSNCSHYCPDCPVTRHVFSLRPVRFEVWDRDKLWNDNLLGKVSLVPSEARSMKKRFPLKHGSLYVSFSAVCAPSLTGALCERYSPTPQAQGGQCSPHEQLGLGLTWGQAPQKHAWRNALL